MERLRLFVPNSKRQGQVSLLMVMTFLPAFVLFAFVINLGLLVHAKIQIQNAADLAAYAGAATQARHMTQISHLNYLMRMNYKLFMSRYLVLGNKDQRCFPGTPAYSTPRCARVRASLEADYAFKNPGATPGDDFPGVPAVCVQIGAGQGNICQLDASTARNLTLRPISCISDTTCPAINDALARIASIQSADCGARGNINWKVLTSWLYNTNNDPANVMIVMDSIRGLVQPIGLIPSNLLLKARIDTLRKYVNEPGRTLNLSQLPALDRAPDQAQVERSIMALRTARGNLSMAETWGIFVDGSLKLEELLPQAANAEGTNLLELEEIKFPSPVSVFYVYSGPNDPRGASPLRPAAELNENACAVQLGELSILPNSLPLGVYKKSGKRVYYAVKLTAKPKLLFNPFGEDFTISAYAAAVPFGSRIGPYIDPSSLVKTVQIPTAHFVVPAGNSPPVNPTVEKQIPVMPFSDSFSYANSGLLKSFMESLINSNGGTAGGLAVSTDAIQNFEAVALGPDPIEVGKYNIPVDPLRGVNAFYERYPGNSNSYRLWAPFNPLGQSASTSPRERISQILDEAFGVSHTGGDAESVLRTGLTNGLEAYFASLESGGNRYDGNSMNVAAIPNPLKKASELGAIRGGSGGPAKVSSPAELATSWPDPLFAVISAPAGPGARRREGYSVKIVTLATALRGGETVSNLENPPEGNSPAAAVPLAGFSPDTLNDIPLLKY